MNASTLRIEWDENNRKEIEEAKLSYQKARQQNRVITDLKGTPITVFKPELQGFLVQQVELQEGQIAVRILDETGDRRLIWDALDPKQLKEVAGLFTDYLKRGWRAYAVSADGKRKRRIHSFEEDSQEVLFEEISLEVKLDAFVKKVETVKPEVKTVREQLDAFVAKFRDVQMVPKTYPG